MDRQDAITTAVQPGDPQGKKRSWYRRRRPATVATVGVAAASVIAGGLATWALAKPATAVMYPEGASATRFIGLAFDTCAAPKREVMQAWKQSSPYGAIGIYISGGNRACGQRELGKGWIGTSRRWAGSFSPSTSACRRPARTAPEHPMSRDLETAYQQGRKAAGGALKAAASLGLQPGSALYSDIESFSSRDEGCADAVRSYLSGWTFRLHRNGYLSGVYGNLQSAVRTLSASHGTENFMRPDVVWNAQWDGETELTGWAGVPDQHWALGQRVKQYLGDHYESYGGYRLNIDSNAVDAPVATVAQPFQVTGAAAVTAHEGPNITRPVLRSLNAGDTVNLVCQIGTPGGKWVKLPDGTWVPDSAIASGAAKPTLPPCSVPFQVDPQWAWTRTGPGTEYVEREAAVRRDPGLDPVRDLRDDAGPPRLLGQPGRWGLDVRRPARATEHLPALGRCAVVRAARGCRLTRAGRPAPTHCQ